MKNYEIIETEKKFNKDDIYAFYNVQSFEPLISLDTKSPICKIPFIKFYAVENNFLDKMVDLISCDGKVLVLLKDDFNKIYATDDNGYILSDNFENYIYFCDEDIELDVEIKRIGTEIIKKTYFTYPIYNRSINLLDNKLIISSEYIAFINLLSKDDIDLGKYNKLDKVNIQEIIYDLLVENKECLSLSELSDNIKEFLIFVEKRYGKINNIYDVQKEYINDFNDIALAKTLVIETENKIIVINTGFID